VKKDFLLITFCILLMWKCYFNELKSLKDPGSKHQHAACDQLQGRWLGFLMKVSDSPEELVCVRLPVSIT